MKVLWGDHYSADSLQLSSTQADSDNNYFTESESLTSIPISDQLCEHWLRNNHLLNFHTSFLDKQAFELFFCLAVPVK